MKKIKLEIEEKVLNDSIKLAEKEIAAWTGFRDDMVKRLEQLVDYGKQGKCTP